jgi:hypothetical protein
VEGKTGTGHHWPQVLYRGAGVNLVGAGLFGLHNLLLALYYMVPDHHGHTVMRRCSALRHAWLGLMLTCAV